MDSPVFRLSLENRSISLTAKPGFSITRYRVWDRCCTLRSHRLCAFLSQLRLYPSHIYLERSVQRRISRGTCLRSRDEECYNDSMSAHDGIIAHWVKEIRTANQRRIPSPFTEGDLVYISTKNMSFPKGLARNLSRSTSDHIT